MDRPSASAIVGFTARRPAGKTTNQIFQRTRVHHVGEGYLSANYIRKLNTAAGGLRLSRQAIGYIQFIMYRLIRSATRTAASHTRARRGNRITLEDVMVEPIRSALPRDLPYDAFKRQSPVR